MNVKGIVIEGKDGQEYLLGIGSRSSGAQKERPTIWRRTGDGWTSLELTREASITIRDQLDLSAPLQPGLNHDEHVKFAVLESLSAFMSTFFADVRW